MLRHERLVALSATTLGQKSRTLLYGRRTCLPNRLHTKFEHGSCLPTRDTESGSWLFETGGHASRGQDYGQKLGMVVEECRGLRRWSAEDMQDSTLIDVSEYDIL